MAPPKTASHVSIRDASSRGADARQFLVESEPQRSADVGVSPLGAAVGSVRWLGARDGPSLVCCGLKCGLIYGL